MIRFIKILSILTLAAISSKSFAAEKLIFAIDIIRHGDRTPFIHIPNSPYNFSLAMSELTPLGMQHEYNLGQKLRALYVDKYKLLPEHYESDDIYIRSSDTNRTLMSAQSLLIGLYPMGSGPKLANNEPSLPNLFQPVPIHTVPLKEDSLLAYNDLPNIDKLMNEIVFLSKEYKDLEFKYKAKITKWNEITGLKMKNVKDVIPFYDHLMVRTANNIPMPSGITNEDRDEIIALGNLVISTKFKDYKLGRYISTNLRKSIREYLAKAASSESPLKFVLFSAHDSTIMPLMSAFRAPLHEIPPYASDLKILLVFNEDMQRNEVKLSFNEKDIYLPDCKNQICNLDDFLKAIK